MQQSQRTAGVDPGPLRIGPTPGVQYWGAAAHHIPSRQNCQILTCFAASLLTACEDIFPGYPASGLRGEAQRDRAHFQALSQCPECLSCRAEGKDGSPLVWR